VDRDFSPSETACDPVSPPKSDPDSASPPNPTSAPASAISEEVGHVSSESLGEKLYYESRARSSAGISLNFINQSADLQQSQIVIFQKNVAGACDHGCVAWKVIQNCGPGGNHPFLFETSKEIGASDSYGNYVPRCAGSPGDAFQVSATSSGDTLSKCGNASWPTEVEISNNLSKGAINAVIYRSGVLLATTEALAPRQIAAFEFLPTIWIGAVQRRIFQGALLSPAVIEQCDTELSLLGIASADIVMTGGGPGQSSTRLTFSLQNVVFD
jgi:hypothetical protein